MLRVLYAEPLLLNHPSCCVDPQYNHDCPFVTQKYGNGKWHPWTLKQRPPRNQLRWLQDAMQGGGPETRCICHLSSPPELVKAAEVKATDGPSGHLQPHAVHRGRTWYDGRVGL